MKASEQNTWFGAQAWNGVNTRSEQQGLYNLLVAKKGISLEKVKECLMEYSTRFINRDNKGNVCQDQHFIISCATFDENFHKFLAIVTEKTGIEFKKHPRRKRKDPYQEWWDECNMDGTFAYSGATDDF